MLKCRDVAQHASAFIDGQIPWHQRPAWYLHLLVCHHCRRFVRHLRTTIQVAGRLGRRPATQAQVAQIVHTCEKHSDEPSE